MSLEEKLTTIQNILSSFSSNEDVDVFNKAIKVKGGVHKCK